MFVTDPFDGNLAGFPGKRAVLYYGFLVLSVLFMLSTLFLAAGCGVEPQPKVETERPPERGQALYGQLCQTCHGDAVTGAGGNAATPPHGPQGHTWHHPDGQLEAIILGQFTYPGRTMPSFHSQLSKEEVAAILDYLKEGWTTEQREVQAEASRNWEEYQNSGQ
jgi:mono/diheme cytochrome c family protein